MIACLGFLLIGACASTGPVERTLLRNPDMEPSPSAIDKYGIGVETYREGSTGGNGSSSQGGCGCY
jgi:hypothetical protein